MDVSACVAERKCGGVSFEHVLLCVEEHLAPFAKRVSLRVVHARILSARLTGVACTTDARYFRRWSLHGCPTNASGSGDAEAPISEAPG